MVRHVESRAAGPSRPLLDSRLRGNDEGAAGLAPLTTGDVSSRHPRESGGPDGPYLPAATRNWRPCGCSPPKRRPRLTRSAPAGRAPSRPQAAE